MADAEATAEGFEVELGSTGDSLSPPAALYPSLAAELRRFVLGVVRDQQRTDDVMQATFVKAVEHGREARSETSRGWLFQVAYHEALAARRNDASRDRNHQRLADLCPQADARPDDPLIRSEAVEAVRKALLGLPEDHRRVVLARIYEDKTFAEIAREFNLPLGTVLTRMRRALDKLRRTIRPGD